MNKEINNLKKRLIYRSQYRGTKEMDKLIGSFVQSNINKFDHHSLTVKNYAKAIFDLARDENYQFSWVAPDAQEDITHSFEDTSFRIVGSDYKNNFSFKHKYNHLLRNRPKGTEVDTHWSRYKGPIF